jgi:hypothetical protein
MQRRVAIRRSRTGKPAPATGVEELRENATQAARLLRALSNENRLLRMVTRRCMWAVYAARN